MKLKTKFIVRVLFFIFIFLLVGNQTINAQSSSLKTYNSKLELVNELAITNGSEGGFMDFALVDLGGDGFDEIVVGYGYQDRPEVIIYRADGSIVNRWYPYGVGYEGRVNVATGDLNNDGYDEIVTSPGENGGPHIRIFDGYGNPKYHNGFFADQADYRNGVELTVADFTGDGNNEIIVSVLKNGINYIKVFNAFGIQIGNTLEVESADSFEPMKIEVANILGDDQPEIILASAIGSSPWVYILNNQGQLLRSFLAYTETFYGGMDLAIVDYQGQLSIVTAAGFGGGPHVRIFDQNGVSLIDYPFFVYNEDFRGGLNVSAGHFGNGQELVFLPQTLTMKSEITAFGKVIKVDISEQKLYAYERGRLVKSFLVSTGKLGFDTPLGNFNVFKKRPLVRMSWFYGPNNPNNYDLPNVPHVLSFKGPYTIHGAYWHENWGHRMSHGCVNVALPEAEWLYNWTPMGTTVIIQK